MKKDKKNNVLHELREIREKMSVKYWQHPEKLLKDLKDAHEKFNLAEKTKPKKS